MRLVQHILGSKLDEHLGERLHALEHQDSAVDRLVVRSADIQRRRFKARTEGGHDVAVALSRDEILFDGAVLACEADYALLVAVPQTHWLRFAPRDTAAALELAYNAGNLHWRVKYDGAVLLVAQEGPTEAYRARLRRLLDTGAVTLETAPDRSDAC